MIRKSWVSNNGSAWLIGVTGLAMVGFVGVALFMAGIPKEIESRNSRLLIPHSGNYRNAIISLEEHEFHGKKAPVLRIGIPRVVGGRGKLLAIDLSPSRSTHNVGVLWVGALDSSTFLQLMGREGQEGSEVAIREAQELLDFTQTLAANGNDLEGALAGLRHYSVEPRLLWGPQRGRALRDYRVVLVLCFMAAVLLY